MGKIYIKLFRIWISGLGGGLSKVYTIHVFSSGAHFNNLVQLSGTICAISVGGHNGEQFCKIILKMGQWF